MGIMLLTATTLYAAVPYRFSGTGGDKKKEATQKVIPAHSPFSNLKTTSTLQLSLNNCLQPGFKFSGDFTSQQDQDRNTLSVHSLMTYQKGNTIYIYPYMQHLFLSKFKTPERVLR